MYGKTTRFVDEDRARDVMLNFSKVLNSAYSGILVSSLGYYGLIAGEI